MHEVWEICENKMKIKFLYYTHIQNLTYPQNCGPVEIQIIIIWFTWNFLHAKLYCFAVWDTKQKESHVCLKDRMSESWYYWEFTSFEHVIFMMCSFLCHTIYQQKLSEFERAVSELWYHWKFTWFQHVILANGEN